MYGVLLNRESFAEDEVTEESECPEDVDVSSFQVKLKVLLSLGFKRSVLLLASDCKLHLQLKKQELLRRLSTLHPPIPITAMRILKHLI